MSVGAVSFRVALCAAWVVLLVITVHAVRLMGLSPAVTLFMAGFSNPWTAQFNTDFLIHVVLVGAWMVYRSRSWAVGIICALLAINLGSMFTLAYLLVASVQTKGDFKRLLLGARLPSVASS